jgi:probable rRNA maturation factor
LIDVDIDAGEWPPESEAFVREVAEAVLAAVLQPSDDDGVAIRLTDDSGVQALNARFRHQDKPTNVLSFPAPPNPEGHLGDVALAYGVCAREAAEQGKSLEHHLKHLVAHGVLHLVGYDHMDDAEAEEMESLERVILAGLGIADPYAAAQDEHD